MQLTLLLATGLVSLASAQTSGKSLIVDTPPNALRPYVVQHLKGVVLNLMDTAMRFPITAGSSNGKMTLLSTHGNAAVDLNVPAHRHVARYENFFCSRGGVQLWTQQWNGTQQVRKLTAGDMAASPSNATHTFQIVEPNTEMYGVVFAGGLEDMFFAFARNTSYATYSPFDPAQASAASGFGGGFGGGFSGGFGGGFGGSTPAANPYDIYMNPSFVARRDLVNGSAPSTTGWHSKNNVLPTDPNEPYYVARDMGPKYLSKEAGFYQVIMPVSTPKQSTYHNFTISWIAMATLPANVTPPTYKFAGHSGFRVDEGAMMLEVDGYEPVQLLHGDVASLPPNTPYRYYSKVTYTKALYFAAEHNGLDTTLIAGAKSWDSPIWPIS